MANELCPCGQPLHYANPLAREAAELLIGMVGPNVRVTVGGRTWLVPRHYVALHGIKPIELPFLDFCEEVFNGEAAPVIPLADEVPDAE